MKADLTKKELLARIAARNTFVWLVSPEEKRVEDAVVAVARSAVPKYDVRFWDCADGIRDAAGRLPDDADEDGIALFDKDDPNTWMKDPMVALDYVGRAKSRTLYVFRDLNDWMDPQVKRKLRSLAKQLQDEGGDQARVILVLTPSSDIPDGLQPSVIEWPLPDREEMGAILTSTLTGLPDVLKDAADLSDETREAAIDAALGLGGQEAKNSFYQSLSTVRVIDPSVITAEKEQVIRRVGGIEWVRPNPRGLDAIGGLTVLKDYLVEAKVGFSQEARDYGLPAPKGVFVCGVSGTGKTLTAQCVAESYGLPLLKLDLGGQKSEFVGKSEQNIRKAFRTVESVSPCVLHIDEIEKALRGSTGPQGDGGVASDALGVILDWLQERIGTVFVVATANDPSELPPELYRKGRWDELFFVDLPGASDRRDILPRAVAHYGQNPARVLSDTVKVEELVRATNQMVGAEIDALVPAAMKLSFKDGRRPLEIRDLLAVVGQSPPLSKTAAEKVKALRKWADGRCRWATADEEMVEVEAETGPEALLEVVPS